MNKLFSINRCYFHTLRCTISKTPSNILAPKNVLPNVYIVRAAHEQKKIRSTMNYMIAIGVMTVGLSYAAVPLYRIFCQAYSYGGTTGQIEANETISNMKPIKDRPLKIRFNADVASSMQWNFKPQQGDITVLPGETALAFYTARNPTDKAVIGISTYNVIPFEAGQYFNKIQCFCFEEQLLNPHEQVKHPEDLAKSISSKCIRIEKSMTDEIPRPIFLQIGQRHRPHIDYDSKKCRVQRVDMPVFFYIDPEFKEDPKMEYIDEIVLSYTFFEAKEGLKLPIPAYAR